MKYDPVIKLSVTVLCECMNGCYNSSNAFGSRDRGAGGGLGGL